MHLLRFFKEHRSETMFGVLVVILCSTVLPFCASVRAGTKPTGTSCRLQVKRRQSTAAKFESASPLGADIDRTGAKGKAWGEKFPAFKTTFPVMPPDIPCSLA